MTVPPRLGAHLLPPRARILWSHPKGSGQARVRSPPWLRRWPRSTPRCTRPIPPCPIRSRRGRARPAACGRDHWVGVGQLMGGDGGDRIHERLPATGRTAARQTRGQVGLGGRPTQGSRRPPWADVRGRAIRQGPPQSRPASDRRPGRPAPEARRSCCRSPARILPADTRRDREVGDAAVGVSGIQRHRGRRALFHRQPDLGERLPGAGGDHTVPDPHGADRAFDGCSGAATFQLGFDTGGPVESVETQQPQFRLRRTCGRRMGDLLLGTAAQLLDVVEGRQPLEWEGHTPLSRGQHRRLGIDRKPAKRDHRGAATKALIKPELRRTHRRPGQRVQRLQRDVFSIATRAVSASSNAIIGITFPAAAMKNTHSPPVHRRTAARRGPG